MNFPNFLPFPPTNSSPFYPPFPPGSLFWRKGGPPPIQGYSTHVSYGLHPMPSCLLQDFPMLCYPLSCWYFLTLHLCWLFLLRIKTQANLSSQNETKRSSLYIPTLLPLLSCFYWTSWKGPLYSLPWGSLLPLPHLSVTPWDELQSLSSLLRLNILISPPFLPEILLSWLVSFYFLLKGIFT